MRRAAAIAPLLLLWGLPLAAVVIALIPTLWDIGAWRALFAHPQLAGGLALSLWTGTASTALALVIAITIVMGLADTVWGRMLQGTSGLMLSLPHLALAVGLAVLIMPSGLIARILVGGAAPPDWVTLHDPLGLTLIAALVLKEVPFLVALLVAGFAQGDAAQRLQAEMGAARGLGHGSRSAWLRVVLPQLLPRLGWPLLITWTYSATVVDMALVLGPTAPPTLAQVLWRDLSDADAMVNARGAAGAVLLLLVLAAIALVMWDVIRHLLPKVQRWLTRGPVLASAPRALAELTAGALVAVYGLVVMLLLFLSIAPLWPWPAVLPPAFSVLAWQGLPGAPVFTTLWLALLVSAAALVSAILWFEITPAPWDRPALMIAALLLALPPLLLATGQNRALLATHGSGTAAGLFLVHLAPAMAYVLLVLAGPYRAFDARYTAVARSLHVSPSALWWRVKRPLLSAPLALSAAIAFAVSVAQFVPAQLAAAGRFTTLPMAAITLASGGNRALLAATAFLLAALPALAFLAAAWAGRPRWR